jgi:hypothetical protein
LPLSRSAEPWPRATAHRRTIPRRGTCPLNAHARKQAGQTHHDVTRLAPRPCPRRQRPGILATPGITSVAGFSSILRSVCSNRPPDSLPAQPNCNSEKGGLLSRCEAAPASDGREASPPAPSKSPNHSNDPITEHQVLCRRARTRRRRCGTYRN